MQYIKSNIFLIKLVLFLVFLSGIIFYIFTLKNEIKTLKNHEKMNLNRISTLNTEIKVLKENGRIEVVNAEISESSTFAIEEIKKLREVDQHEELAAHDHIDYNSSIFDGMFFKNSN